ncbi:MAG: 16S rRNA processing protein RimM [Bacteroidia bacterium]|nr:16S rRNA processing protein RimM [Bacteroidia bacterium]
MDKVSIGKIISTVGLRGEVKVFSTTDFPHKRFKKDQAVALFDVATGAELATTITMSHKAGERYTLTFSNVNSIEEANQLVGRLIMIDKVADQLPKGFFFHDDLVGCAVYDEQSMLIGHISKIEDYPAHRTLRIQRAEGSDVLVPFVKFFIKSVNIETRTIIVRIIEGML